MLRFSLVLTNDLGLTRWQIHKAECTDVTKMLKQGAFMEILSADSPESLVKRELNRHLKDGWSEENYKIMPCCDDLREAAATAE